jgi:23S rRNA pseudouridine1911/1915/1917 synthase
VNQGYEYRERIGPDAEGRAVLAHLSQRYRHSTEATWRRRLAEGEILLEGREPSPTEALRTGQTLVWRRPPWEEPPVPLSFAVLHLDEELLAVGKPRGLPTIPHGGLYLTHTLVHQVRRHWPEATPMHRLGRGTSGLVLLARTKAARQAVTTAWREGRVEKRYLALVSGIPAEATFTVDASIGPVPHPRLGQVHAVSQAGKPSVSHVKKLAARDQQTLVEVSIPTGRPHQIRIHLAAAGHPLVGDPLYGPGGLPLADPALPGEGGFWLPSHPLGLGPPATGHHIELECPPPPPLRI